MGLLQNLAAAAIRAKVITTLKENCPPPLQAGLEELLNSKESVALIQNLISSCFAHPSNLTLEALLALPFPPEIRQLLCEQPELVQYLIQTALSRLPH